MLTVAQLYGIIRNNYGVRSNAKLLVRVKGSNEKFELNGIYFTFTQQLGTIIGLHTANEGYDCITVSKFLEELKSYNGSWCNTTPILYDADTQHNDFIDIILTKSTITLIVDFSQGIYHLNDC